MSTFLKSVLIPLALALAGWAAAGNIQGAYQVVFVISVLLVALFTALLSEKPRAKRSASQHSPLLLHRVALVVGAVIFILVATTSALLGSRAKKRAVAPATRSSLSSTTDPNKSASASGSTTSDLDNKRPSISPLLQKGHTPTPPDADSSANEFVRRYVDATLAVSNGHRRRWAVVISDSHHVDFPELNSGASAAITVAGYQNVSLFRPSLVREDKLQELYEADPVLMHALSQFCDGVVVAKVDSNRLPDAGPEGLVTVEISMTVRAISTAMDIVKADFTVVQQGAGFTLKEAERNARERASRALEEQLQSGLR